MKKRKTNSDLFSNNTPTPVVAKEPDANYGKSERPATVGIVAGTNYRHFLGGTAYAPIQVLRPSGNGYEVKSTISGFRYFLSPDQICN